MTSTTNNPNKIIRLINQSNISRICTSQIIFDLSSTIKELIDNSLDANATKISITLTNSGIDKIELNDNGVGIYSDSRELVCLKHTTSKIRTFDDIYYDNNFNTFQQMTPPHDTLGFRGEALYGLSNISESIIITTKTKNDKVGQRIEYSNGIMNKKTIRNVPRTVGTTVIIQKLFHKLPVRRVDFVKRIKNQKLKLMQLLQGYAILCPSIQFVYVEKLKNSSRNIKLQTSGKCVSFKDVVNEVLGSSFVRGLCEIKIDLENIINYHPNNPNKNKNNTPNNIYYISGLVSKAPGSCQLSSELQLFSINGRPVDLPKFQKILRNVYKSFQLPHSYCYRKPSCVFCMYLPKYMYDVNVSPDKRQVLLNEEEKINDLLKEKLEELYKGQVEGKFDMDEVEKVSQKSEKKLNKYILPQKSAKSTNIDRTKEQNNNDEDKEIIKKIKLNEFELRHVVDSKMVLKTQELFQNIHRNTPNNKETTYNNCSTIIAEDSDPKTMFQKYTFDGNIINDIKPRSIPKNKDFYIHLEKKKSYSKNSPIPSKSQILLTKEMSIQWKNNKKCSENSMKNAKLHKEKESVKYNLPMDNLSSNNPNQLPTTINTPEHTNETETHMVSNSSSHTSGTEFASINSSHKSDTSFKFPLTSSQTGSPSIDIYSKCAKSHKILSLRNQTKNTLLGVSQHSVKLRSSFSISQTNDTNLYASQQYNKSFDDKNNFVWKGFCDESHVMQCVKLARLRMLRLRSQLRTKISPMEKIQERKKSQEEEKVLISKEDFLKMTVIGQFNLGFIVTICPNNNLWILDQHACDEIYNFERLIQSTIIHQQKLISPLPLELLPSEESCILENMSIFEQHGFKFNYDEKKSTGHKLSLIAIPHSGSGTKGQKAVQFDKDDVLALCSILTMDIESISSSIMPGSGTGVDGRGSSSNNAVKRYAGVIGKSIFLPKSVAMFSNRACRGSIMIGDALSQQKMEIIVKRLNRIEHPWNCPHGRPTMRHVKKLSRVLEDDEQVKEKHIAGPNLLLS